METRPDYAEYRLWDLSRRDEYDLTTRELMELRMLHAEKEDREKCESKEDMQRRVRMLEMRAK